MKLPWKQNCVENPKDHEHWEYVDQNGSCEVEFAGLNENTVGALEFHDQNVEHDGDDDGDDDDACLD